LEDGPDLISKKRLFTVAAMVFCGWFGEWSYLASLIRAIIDWLGTGYISAHPRFITPQSLPDWFYGIAWKVAFYRGAEATETIFIQNGFGSAVLVGLAWLFIEYLKGRL